MPDTRRLDDPGHPPPTGRYASAEWHEPSGRWRVRLTDAGWRFLADWRAEHPRLLSLFRLAWPSAYAAAKASRQTDEDIECSCVDAAMRAAEMFDPDRAAFSTYLSMWLRAKVNQVTRNLTGHRRHGVEVCSGNDPIPGSEGGSIFESLVEDPRRYPRPTPAEQCDSKVIAEAVEVAVANGVTLPRDRRVVAARFGLDGRGGRSIKELAAEFGLTVEGVRQLLMRSLLKLRPFLAEAADQTV